MLLIGIAGANATARERVARAMRDAQICTVSVYTDAPAQRFGSHAEVARRMQRLEGMISATPAKGAECLVVAHVVHRVEAERIRKLGGHVVHVEGVPSDEVPIVRGDLLATATKDGHRHFIDGEAALSELWAKRGVV